MYIGKTYVCMHAKRLYDAYSDLDSRLRQHEQLHDVHFMHAKFRCGVVSDFIHVHTEDTPEFIGAAEMEACIPEVV